MEWISAKSRLPNEDEAYYLVTDGIIVRCACFSRGSWWERPRNMGIPTHWMPLPEIPKCSNCIGLEEACKNCFSTDGDCPHCGRLIKCGPIG